MNNKRKPFIPKNLPKSLVISYLSLLIGLGFGVIGFISGFLDLIVIKNICAITFICSVIVFLVSYIFHTERTVRGKYSNIESKDWKDQIW